jgi:hypothetical protein
MMIGALTLGAVPAQADPMWRDIEAGMTVEQVRALYPLEQGEGRKVEHKKRNTELHGFMTIGNCKPRVEILHPDGKVAGILIWMRDEGILKPTCTAEARLALFEKFGAPDMDNTRRSILPAYAEQAQESLTWIEPKMTVEWRGDGGLSAWSIVYRAAPISAADQL